MNLLISGITGFVGTNLSAFLRNSFPQVCIYGLSRSPDKVPGQIDNCKGVYSELDAQLLDTLKIDAIIHLAGIAHDISGQYMEEDYYKANYKYASSLYDEFLNSDYTGKFIFISSVKALADTVDDELTEGFKPNPKTAYGKSKRAAEEYILKHAKTGKNFYILRPVMVYGPLNKGNLNLLYGLIKRGLPYPLGAFNNQRSFLSINNLCFVILEIALKNIPVGDYNCSDDRCFSTVEVVNIIGKVLKKRPIVMNIHPKIIHALAKFGSVLDLPFNKDVVGKLTNNYRVSNTKMMRALGISQMPYNAKSELIKTISSYERS